MWRTILTALLATACALNAAPVKIHGYITSISSLKAFDIDNYQITRDDSLVFELDKGDYPDATFRPEDLRVGTELDVQGEFNDATRELHATAIKVFLNDNLCVKRAAIIEHTAVLQRDGYGWKGIVHADGQTIKVGGQTRFVLKEGQTNQLTPGLSILYEGRRERDGTIAATRFEIFSNEAGRVEQKLLRDITPKLNSSGEIAIRGVKYKLVPDAEAQSYVQRVGAKLVPAFYQQDLSNGAAHRLAFQFYLIENPDFNAHAFPNGTVLVNSGVLKLLANEAQFAAVLGHEIAHATQEHTLREMQHQKKSRDASVGEKGYAGGNKGDPLGNGYSRSLENQADRVGLEYMVAAGYDAREAAEVWHQVAGAARDSKIFWNGLDDSTSRRSYLLSEIRNNYSGVNFQSYVRNREEFDQLAGRFGNTAIAQREPITPVLKATANEAPVRPGIQKHLQTPATAQVSTGPTESSLEAQGDHLGANTVVINSDPPGASVVMNGVVIGKTPMILPTGNVGLPFVITVKKAGYRDWTGQLVSVPGRTSLRVDLFPVR
jgi:hypothetical protein